METNGFNFSNTLVGDIGMLRLTALFGPLLWKKRGLVGKMNENMFLYSYIHYVAYTQFSLSLKAFNSKWTDGSSDIFISGHRRDSTS